MTLYISCGESATPTSSPESTNCRSTCRGCTNHCACRLERLAAVGELWGRRYKTPPTLASCVTKPMWSSNMDGRFKHGKGNSEVLNGPSRVSSSPQWQFTWISQCPPTRGLLSKQLLPDVESRNSQPSFQNKVCMPVHEVPCVQGVAIADC
jgi:hypothetical protein